MEFLKDRLAGWARATCLHYRSSQGLRWNVGLGAGGASREDGSPGHTQQQNWARSVPAALDSPVHLKLAMLVCWGCCHKEPDWGP